MITQRQIAERLGISPTTVSFVLNGQAEAMKISPLTVKRVREVVDELGNRTLPELMGSGKLFQGQQTVTEQQIAERFKVSRPVATKILNSLVSEGLLQFKKEVGSFVNTGMLDYDLRRLVSFTDKARAAGRVPKTRVLKFERLNAKDLDASVALQLALEPDDDVFYFERLRLADKQSVILERRHVPAKLCPEMNARELTGSLYGLWVKRYGLNIGGAEQVIRAVNLKSGDAKLLGVPPRTAALQVVATGFLASKEPLWYEQTTYRPDAYEFQAVLGGVGGTSRQVIGRFAEIRGS